MLNIADFIMLRNCYAFRMVDNASHTLQIQPAKGPKSYHPIRKYLAEQLPPLAIVINMPQATAYGYGTLTIIPDERA